MKTIIDTESQNEIIEGNKLIAEFMGFTERFDLRTDGKPMYQSPIKGNETHSACFAADNNEEFLQLKYHTSWDWLMPVVEKIGEIKINDASAEGCELYDNIDYALRPAKIEAVWLAVVDFIKWYNENKA